MFRNCSPMHSKQQGNVLIVAIFTLIILGGLASTMVRIGWSDGDTHAREVLSAQAWLLTHSANEWALTQFYPLQATSTSFSDICSDTVDGADYTNITDKRCSSVTLGCRSVGSAELTLFIVESTAVCGTNFFQVERRQEVWVREE